MDIGWGGGWGVCARYLTYLQEIGWWESRILHKGIGQRGKTVDHRVVDSNGPAQHQVLQQGHGMAG